MQKKIEDLRKKILEPQSSTHTDTVATYGLGVRNTEVPPRRRISEWEGAHRRLRLPRRYREAETLAEHELEQRVFGSAGRYIGEGFDDARLDTLFLALPFPGRGPLSQYAGRLHPQHEGKREVRIYDYVDPKVPLLMRMFGKRLVTYRAIGYAPGSVPLKFEEPREERTVEYEEDVDRNAHGPEALGGLE